MAKFKEFIKVHKKLSIGICVGIIVLIIGIVAGVFFLNKSKTGDNSETKDVSAGDWDNLMADLENEPVSEFDEVYKDSSDMKTGVYKIAVNKTRNYITVYGKDKDGKYTKIVKEMVCSAGFDTPVGTFTTSDKYTWKIVNGNVWAQNATRVVGNVLIHSMPYKSKDKGTLLPDYYNQLGRTLSASCIRVSAGDSDWLLNNCAKGTVVEIYESEDISKTVPRAIKVPDDATWDPTDPDDNNPWNDVVLEFKGLENVINIERGSQFDYMQGIEITDTCGNDISSLVKVDTEMDVFTPGVYIAKYQVTDATGKKAEREVSFQVQDTLAPKLSGLMSTMYFSSVEAVTKDSILKGVSLLDNNQVMGLDIVQVVLPVVVEGVNQVAITAADAYGNVMTTTINVIVDSNPPLVVLKAGMGKKIPLTQKVDKEYAMSRIDATDDGKPVEASQISVNIIPKLWGYTLEYKVSDKQGNVTSFKDEVSYVEYSIVPSGKLNITDVSDKTQLLEGVVIKSDDGSKVSTDSIKCTVVQKDGNKYQVTYSYSYSSPLGTKEITATDNFTLKSVDEPTQLPVVSEEPQESEMPGEEPEISNTPPVYTAVP